LETLNTFDVVSACLPLNLKIEKTLVLTTGDATDAS